MTKPHAIKPTINDTHLSSKNELSFIKKLFVDVTIDY